MNRPVQVWKRPLFLCPVSPVSCSGLPALPRGSTIDLLRISLLLLRVFSEARVYFQC